MKICVAASENADSPSAFPSRLVGPNRLRPRLIETKRVALAVFQPNAKVPYSNYIIFDALCHDSRRKRTESNDFFSKFFDEIPKIGSTRIAIFDDESPFPISDGATNPAARFEVGLFHT